jgi:nickel-dependent lactate racemase
VGKVVELNSSAWFGDVPILLDFPASWEIETIGGYGPSLSNDEMRGKLRNPTASDPLSEIARGKKRIVIVVDDLTRPTPVEKILPLVLNELQEAGISSDSVTVVMAGGTHLQPTKEEIGKKIGNDLARMIKVLPHDPEKDLVDLGKTSRGTPIHLNRIVSVSDLVIGVGCIYPHPAAGFSGGSKIIAPGVCGTGTARHMHDYIKGGERGKIDGKNEFREEIEEIAATSGLRFIVNAVLNQRRDVCGLFSGDRVAAHREGVAFATEIYSVKTVMDADVVIVDAYPFDTTFQFAHDRSLWQFEELKNNVSKIIMASCPAGLGNHDLYPLKNPFATRLARRLKNLQWREFRNPSVRIHAIRKIVKRKNQKYLILTKGLVENDMKTIYPKAKLYRTWEDLSRELASSHKTGPVKVCIYRCSPFLLPA